jgi:hypothetical protein
MENERDSKDEGEEAVASKSDLIRAKLGLIGHYVLLAFAPTVAVVALIFAVMAYTGSQSNRARLNETNSRIDNISAIQSEPKGETDIFQVSLAHEKAQSAEERKKQVEKDAKIISNVTQLQVKLKVSPTLDEQLKDDAKAPAVASPAASAPSAAPMATSTVATPAPTPVAVPAPVAVPVEKTPAAQPTAKARAPVEKAPVKNPTPPTAKSAAAAKVPAPAAKTSANKPAPAPTAAEKATKANALKKTLEEFNKIDRSK